MTRAAAIGSAALATWALLSSSGAYADEPIALRYDVNASEVKQGEAFQLDVVLTVTTQKPVEELALPDFPRGLTVVQERKSSSTQISTAGGRQSVTTEQRYMFLLRADEAGTFKIPEATARLGRSIARAAPITVKVVASNDASSSGSSSSSSANDAASGVGAVGARFGKNPPAAFLEVTVDHDVAWVGQQITATTEVYSEQPLAQWPRLAALKPPGFLCTPLLGDERPSPMQKSIGGKLYYVYLANKDALFPVAEGDAAIPAQSVELVPAGSFFNRPRDMSVRAPAVKVKVKALPVDDKPARFVAGNVGVWQLSAAVRPSSATLDQPVTLTIVATGTGSLEQLHLPSWDGGDPKSGGARVFPATTKIERRDTSNDSSELGGRVITEMLVQPQQSGELRVPSFTLAYFDPFSGAYKTTSSQPIVVPVRAGRGGPSTTSAGANPRQTIAKGARPLRAHVVASSTTPSEAPLYAGAGVLALGIASFVAGSRRRRMSASHEGKRAAQKRERRRALDDAKARGDLAGFERVLVEALADRCGPEVKSRASADLAALLEERGLDRTLAVDVVAFIQDVEAARYSPAGGERARLAEACVALIHRVEAP